MNSMLDDSRKLFYSIGEVASYFNVNESTLRFWEKEFPKAIKPRKNAKGTRSYTKSDIEDIRLIHFLLKEKGMTIAGARKKIREEKKGMTAQHELATRLKKIKSELLRLQQELGTPVEEAPEFPSVELETSGRYVFAEPDAEMIPISVPFEEDLIDRPVPEDLFDQEIIVPEPFSSDAQFVDESYMQDNGAEAGYSEEEDQSWKDEYLEEVQPAASQTDESEEEIEVPEPERFFRENNPESEQDDKGWKGELF